MTVGTLTPGAKYKYKTVNGVTYSKQEGAKDWEVVGYKYDSRTDDGRPMIDHMRDNQLWHDIRRAARTNPTLQEALNQCIMIYKLSKDYDNGI